MKFKKGDIVRLKNETRKGNKWIYKINGIVGDGMRLTDGQTLSFNDKLIRYSVSRYDGIDEIWDYWYLYEDEIYKLNEKELFARLI